MFLCSYWSIYAQTKYFSRSKFTIQPQINSLSRLILSLFKQQKLANLSLILSQLKPQKSTIKASRVWGKIYVTKPLNLSLFPSLRSAQQGPLLCVLSVHPISAPPSCFQPPPPPPPFTHHGSNHPPHSKGGLLVFYSSSLLTLLLIAGLYRWAILSATHCHSWPPVEHQPLAGIPPTFGSHHHAPQQLYDHVNRRYKFSLDLEIL